MTYEAVNEMTYLEMFIEETQRMYPAATRLDRVCNQDYEFEGINKHLHHHISTFEVCRAIPNQMKMMR